MIILGIETATPQVGCALGGQEGVLASFHASKGHRHAEIITPAIKFITEQARTSLNEVSVVAVDIGPGLFTGLRVGIATGKAIAQALRVPMIGLSSLDLLAFPVRSSDRLIASVIDARRGEIFYAFYRRVAGGVQRITEPHVSNADELAGELVARREECLLVGDGALRYSEIFQRASHVEIGTTAHSFPSADSLVDLAQPRALREEFVQPWELEPIYLRKASADISWEQRAGTGDGGSLREERV